MISSNQLVATWGLALPIAQGALSLVPDPPIQCDACGACNREREPFRIFGDTYYVANLICLGFRSQDIRLIVNSQLPPT